MSEAKYKARQREIWDSYTDFERAHMGIIGEWMIPGTRNIVLQYRSPSRLQKAFAELRKMQGSNFGSAYRSSVVRRDDLGDGLWTAVTYLFEREEGVDE